MLTQDLETVHRVSYDSVKLNFDSSYGSPALARRRSWNVVFTSWDFEPCTRGVHVECPHAAGDQLITTFLAIK